MAYVPGIDELKTEIQKTLPPEEPDMTWLKEKEEWTPPGTDVLVNMLSAVIPGVAEVKRTEKGAIIPDVPAPDAISQNVGLGDPADLLTTFAPMGLAAGAALSGIKKVDRAMPSPAGLTSKLEDVIRQKMGGKATAQEIGAMVKQAGVKQEELEDIGLEQWLQGLENQLFEKQRMSSLEPSTSVQTPKIQKEEVLGYLDAERPELKQKTYGLTSEEKAIKNKLTKEFDDADSLFKQKKRDLESFLQTHLDSVLEKQQRPAVEAVASKVRKKFPHLNEDAEFYIARGHLKNLGSDKAQNRNLSRSFLYDEVGLTPLQIEGLASTHNLLKVPADILPQIARSFGGTVTEDGLAYFKPSFVMQELLDIDRSNRGILNYLGIPKSDYEPMTGAYREAAVARAKANRAYEDAIYDFNPEPRWARYSLSNQGIGENYREYVYTAPVTDRTRFREIFKAEGHWPGVHDPVYHVRAQDLTDKDGDKLLNVDEIQSDIHQYGQKFGYKKREMTEDEREKAIQILRENGAWRSSGIRPTNTDIVNQAMYLPDEEFAKIQPIFKESGLAVDLPFKKTWHEQAMRRMIKEALDSGKDGVSWTAGSVQAKRAGQDLGDVTSIAYNPASNHLAAYRGDDNIFDKTVPLQKLSQYVGADLAKQLKDGAAKQLAERKAWTIAQQKQDDAALKLYGEWLKKNDLSPENLDYIEAAKAAVSVLFRSDREKLIEELTSAGLTPTQLSDILTQRIGNPPRMEVIEVPATAESFGGSGMKKFYDEKVVNFARQEAKRLGGTVTQTTVKSSTGEEIPIWKFKFGPKTKELSEEKGFPLYAAPPIAVGVGEVVRQYKKEQEQKKEY